jgi:hypothetical protein
MLQARLTMTTPFTSDPDVDKAYSPSRALPEGVFQAHMDLYRERSLEVYRTGRTSATSSTTHEAARASTSCPRPGRA